MSPVHEMLAEGMGGISEGGLFFGGIGASLAALIALIPAARGRRLPTILMIGPAMILGIFYTCRLMAGFIRGGVYNAHEFDIAFVGPWTFIAAPSLATSLVAGLVLWVRRGFRRQPEPRRHVQFHRP
jgi:hypothetical protein